MRGRTFLYAFACALILPGSAHAQPVHPMGPPLFASKGDAAEVSPVSVANLDWAALSVKIDVANRRTRLA